MNTSYNTHLPPGQRRFSKQRARREAWARDLDAKVAAWNKANPNNLRNSRNLPR